MTVAVSYVPVIHAALPGRPDEQDTITTAHDIAATLVRLGHRSAVIDIGADFAPLRALALRRPAVFFNMAETVVGDPTRAAQPVRLMEELGLRFTGCGSEALTGALSKTATKRQLAAHGIATPKWWQAGDAVPPEVRVIVKSDSEHASLGIDAASVVAGSRAGAEMRARQARFGGKFFAEAFVDGREFNIALLQDGEGVQVLPIPEILFDGLPAGAPRIVDYAAKWDTKSHAYWHTPRAFGLEAREPVLAAALTRQALACWRAFGLAGYARVDFRVGHDGAPMVLEINTNPCLAPDAGFAAAAESAGIEYDTLIDRVLDAALHRSEKAA